ncbi:MAG: DUF1801 domain-containing protein [Bacteroidota bacterium]
MIETVPTSVDEYISIFPKDIQKVLIEIRAIMKKAAPEAGEAIKYGMPTLTFHGNMLSYGVFTKHIGVYPAPAGDSDFNKEMEPYRSGKATIKFPLDKPMPMNLISQIVKLRVEATLQNLARKELRKKK